MNLTKFNLEKLYLDCIDAHGNCFVIYYAKLQYSVIKLIYSGLIFSDTTGFTLEKASLKNLAQPQIDDLLLFDNPSLLIKGEWEKISESISISLYSDNLGNDVVWNCHHPKTLTNIRYMDKQFQGFGYAETLSISIKPWNLPIDELRWGRFLSQNTTIIWIHWQGEHPLNKIICNGIIHNDAIFEANNLIFDSGKAVLTFQNEIILRKGKLSNILATMPWLKIIFNSRILRTIEIKYKSKTVFSKNSIIETGWSLYEIVTWKKK